MILILQMLNIKPILLYALVCKSTLVLSLAVKCVRMPALECAQGRFRWPWFWTAVAVAWTILPLVLEITSIPAANWQWSAILHCERMRKVMGQGCILHWKWLCWNLIRSCKACVAMNDQALDGYAFLWATKFEGNISQSIPKDGVKCFGEIKLLCCCLHFYCCTVKISSCVPQQPPPQCQKSLQSEGYLGHWEVVAEKDIGDDFHCSTKMQHFDSSSFAWRHRKSSLK